MILFSLDTVSGGLSAKLTDGNFWQGAATGFIVSTLNHVAHRMNELKMLSSSAEDRIIPPGEIEFKRLTKQQLEEFRVIPEDVSKETPIFTPEKNGIYKGDGFYHKDFSNEKYWYKVSAGGKVTVTYSIKTGYNFMSYRSEFWESIALIAGKPYNVGWESKDRPHWTDNPFDLK